MSARELLLFRRDDAYALVDGALPEVSADVALQDTIAPICEAAEALAGAPVTLTMRLLSPEQSLNVLHCDRAPSLAEWSPLDRVGEHVGALGAEAVHSDAGAPWYRPAFHDRLLRFASDALVERGVRVERPAEQTRVSPLSCIYRLPTGSGVYWVKATRPVAFVPEGPVMAALSEAFPDYVPAPLAFENDCTLFANFGERMEPDRPLAEVEPIFAALARIQIEGDSLLELPHLQRWPLSNLAKDLEASRGVLGEDVDELMVRAERDISDLASFGIGDHLAHGDYYWGNLATKDGQLRIFDWSDASTGHPFFDALYATTGYDETLRIEARNLYLEPWRARVEGDLEAAWAIADRVAPANSLVRNTRLLSYFEPWERPTCEPHRLYWARRFRESYGMGPDR